MADDLGKREKAKAERRLRIVRAARDLIRETGDTELSMRTLAQRAEVSLSTPYNLFGSKRAVVLAVLEDVRDFAKRFPRLAVSNSIDRIFAAHDLAFGYYTSDPDFYRTLWRALLNTTGPDETGLSSPERIDQTRAIWLGMVRAACDDGFLGRDIPSHIVLQAMAHTTGGALLSWAMGSLPTKELTPSVGLGYALILKGAATPAGAPLIDAHLSAYRAQRATVNPASLPNHVSETL